MLHLVRPRIVAPLALLVFFAFPARSSAATYHGPGGPLVDAPAGRADFPIVISGTGATIESVDAVTLNDITHTWFGDTQFTLVAPDGATLVRLSSAHEGATGDPNNANLNGTYRLVVDPTLQTLDEASAPLGDNDDIPSGSYAIATYGGEAAPGPRTTYDPFDGMAADGIWTLRIEDFGPGDTGALGSWSLDVTFVPEPGAMGSIAALGFWGLRRRRR